VVKYEKLSNFTPSQNCWYLPRPFFLRTKHPSYLCGAEGGIEYAVFANPLRFLAFFAVSHAKGKKRGNFTLFPLPVGRYNRKLSEVIRKCLKMQDIGFQPFNLRHAYNTPEPEVGRVRRGGSVNQKLPQRIRPHCTTSVQQREQYLRNKSIQKQRNSLWISINMSKKKSAKWTARLMRLCVLV